MAEIVDTLGNDRVKIVLLRITGILAQSILEAALKVLHYRIVERRSGS